MQGVRVALDAAFTALQPLVATGSVAVRLAILLAGIFDTALDALFSGEGRAASLPSAQTTAAALQRATALKEAAAVLVLPDDGAGATAALTVTAPGPDGPIVITDPCEIADLVAAAGGPVHVIDVFGSQYVRSACEIGEPVKHEASGLGRTLQQRDLR